MLLQNAVLGKQALNQVNSGLCFSARVSNPSEGAL